MDDTQGFDGVRYYDNYVPTLRSQRSGLKVLQGRIDTHKPVLVGGIGEINFGKQYRQGNRIYDSNGIAMACLAQPIGNTGGNSYLYVVEEPEKYCVAMRGRYDENGKISQHLEPRYDGLTNTLTTVQKDNLIVEKF